MIILKSKFDKVEFIVNTLTFILRNYEKKLLNFKNIYQIKIIDFLEKLKPNEKEDYLKAKEDPIKQITLISIHRYRNEDKSSFKQLCMDIISIKIDILTLESNFDMIRTLMKPNYSEWLSNFSMKGKICYSKLSNMLEIQTCELCSGIGDKFLTKNEKVLTTYARCKKLTDGCPQFWYDVVSLSELLSETMSIMHKMRNFIVETKRLSKNRVNSETDRDLIQKNSYHEVTQLNKNRLLKMDFLMKSLKRLLKGKGNQKDQGLVCENLLNIFNQVPRAFTRRTDTSNNSRIVKGVQTSTSEIFSETSSIGHQQCTEEACSKKYSLKLKYKWEKIDKKISNLFEGIRETLDIDNIKIKIKLAKQKAIESKKHHKNKSKKHHKKKSKKHHKKKPLKKNNKEKRNNGNNQNKNKKIKLTYQNLVEEFIGCDKDDEQSLVSEFNSIMGELQSKRRSKRMLLQISSLSGNLIVQESIPPSNAFIFQYTIVGEVTSSHSSTISVQNQGTSIKPHNRFFSQINGMNLMIISNIQESFNHNQKMIQKCFRNNKNKLKSKNTENQGDPIFIENNDEEDQLDEMTLIDDFEQNFDQNYLDGQVTRLISNTNPWMAEDF